MRGNAPKLGFLREVFTTRAFVEGEAHRKKSGGLAEHKTSRIDCSKHRNSDSCYARVQRWPLPLAETLPTEAEQEAMYNNVQAGCALAACLLNACLNAIRHSSSDRSPADDAQLLKRLDSVSEVDVQLSNSPVGPATTECRTILRQKRKDLRLPGSVPAFITRRAMSGSSALPRLAGVGWHKACRRCTLHGLARSWLHR